MYESEEYAYLNSAQLDEIATKQSSIAASEQKVVATNTETTALDWKAQALAKYTDEEIASMAASSGLSEGEIKANIIDAERARLLEAKAVSQAQENAQETAAIGIKNTKLAATEVLNDAEAKELIMRAGQVTQQELENGATVTITTAKLQEAIQTGALTKEEAELVAARIAGSKGAKDESIAIIANANAKAQASTSTGLFSASLAKLKTFAGTTAGKLSILAAAIGACYGVYKGVEWVQSWANGEKAVDKYSEAISNSEKKVQDNENTLSSYNSEVETNKSKIAELQALYDNGTITEAQKAELENLKYNNALLDDKIKKLKEANLEEAKSQAYNAKDSFNTQFNEGSSSTDNNANSVIDRVSKNYGGDGTANGVNWATVVNGNENDSGVQQLAKLKLATDAYNQAVSDFNAGVNNVSQEDVDFVKDNLDEITADFEKNREAMYNSLVSDIEKMKAAEGTEAFDQEAYDNMESWLDIFKKFVPKYKEAMEKVQKEADSNPIDQPVNYDDPTDELKNSKNAENSATNPATLADLQDEADLLSTIQKELDDNGKIGVSSMQSIIEKYPEAKAALSDYMQGIKSQEQLFEELQGIYENDTESYINHLIAESEKDEEFWNSLMTNYPQLFSELAGVYGDDVKNWTSAAQAKAEITANLINQMATAWGNYFMALGNAESGFTLARADNFDDSDIYDSNMLENEWQASDSYNAAVNAWNDKASAFQQQAQADIDRANALLNSIHDYSYDQISSSIDLSWQGMGGYEPSDSGSDSGSGDSGDSGSDSGSEPNPKDYDWIERRVNAISKAYDRLKNNVDDTTRTWEDRNDSLVKSMQVLSNEVQAQSQAYEYYMNAFNSYGLDGYYKDLIMNGAIGTQTITDEGLQDAIDACIDLYDKSQDAKDAVQSLSQELYSLAQVHFDNIQSQFEEELDLINHINTALSNQVDLLETQGYMASTYLYGTMIQEENANLNKLYAERNALINEMNNGLTSGSVEKYSETWYSMQSSINSVSESIQDATSSLAEYKNELRQIEWDAFDRTREEVTNLIDETDFLVNLLEKEKTTDEQGNLTNEGQAAQALLATKYNLDMNQADEYAKEIKKINEELAKDPYNTTLIDRKNELVKAQQDAISSAQSEKDAIKDLVSDAYSAYEDSLSKIIDKYKELMNSIKDAYDYEKSIAEKTKNIANIQKQLAAYQGDNSEEGKKNVQQLKSSLSEAQDDLQQTEYEKLISDTEKLLDDLQNQVEEVFNARLDEVDGLIEDVISQSNENASNIAETIKTNADSVGYTLSDSMKTIWGNSTADIKNVLSTYGNNFTSAQTTLQTSVDGIKSSVQGLLDYANKQAQEAAAEIAQEQSNQGVQVDYDTTPVPETNVTTTADSSNDSNNSSNNGGVNWIDRYDEFPKELLNVDTSIVDRLKMHNWDSSFEARSQYYSEMGGDDEYFGGYSQNVWMLQKMKEMGYASGIRKFKSKDGYAWTNEGLANGSNGELIRTSDGALLTPVGNGGTVFNSGMTNTLWDFANNPGQFMNGLGVNTAVSTQGMNNSVVYSCGDVMLSLPNVNNYEEFCKKAQSDNRFSTMVQEMALGQAMGRNGFNKKVY